MELILEVIVQTVADARAAEDGGADRLEIVRDIGSGGLTPPLPLVMEIASATRLPLRVMVRHNAGYGTDARELEALRCSAAEFASLGVDGIVAGFAEAGALRLDDVHDLLEAAPHVRVTFHRAFDSLRDPLSGIDELARMPQVDSILTSGGEGDVETRCAKLRELASRAGRLRIIAGGGVDEEMFEEIARSGCVSEVHVGRLAREGGDRAAPVSIERVRRLRRSWGGGFTPATFNS